MPDLWENNCKQTNGQKYKDNIKGKNKILKMYRTFCLCTVRPSCGPPTAAVLVVYVARQSFLYFKAPSACPLLHPLEKQRKWQGKERLHIATFAVQRHLNTTAFASQLCRKCIVFSVATGVFNGHLHFLQHAGLPNVLHHLRTRLYAPLSRNGSSCFSWFSIHSSSQPRDPVSLVLVSLTDRSNTSRAI